VCEYVARVGPDDDIRFLDVGCSNGALGRAPKWRREARDVTGIDLEAVLASEASTHGRLRNSG
jgi:2-polyprenyl-3-methyl-5-hydroxy-6-metoxy-1,4-benzoquinol methylase